MREQRERDRFLGFAIEELLGEGEDADRREVLMEHMNERRVLRAAATDEYFSNRLRQEAAVRIRNAARREGGRRRGDVGGGRARGRGAATRDERLDVARVEQLATGGLRRR